MSNTRMVVWKQGSRLYSHLIHVKIELYKPFTHYPNSSATSVHAYSFCAIFYKTSCYVHYHLTSTNAFYYFFRVHFVAWFCVYEWIFIWQQSSLVNTLRNCYRLYPQASPFLGSPLFLKSFPIPYGRYSWVIPPFTTTFIWAPHNYTENHILVRV